jgi:hypothetical protein
VIGGGRGAHGADEAGCVLNDAYGETAALNIEIARVRASASGGLQRGAMTPGSGLMIA